MEPKQIFAIRLKQARVAAGLSLRGLQDALERLVTASAISKYEKGKAMPGSEILIALARALDRPTEFFFRPIGPEIKKVSFRSHDRLSKKREASILQQVRDRVEHYVELEEFVDSRVSFTRPGSGKADGPDDAEAAAEAVREAWRLGSGPLPNVVEMLEEHGVRVIEIEGDCSPNDNFNGCSGKADQMVFVVLAKWLNKDLPRKRLTALHELGHLILDSEHEGLCYRFGAALLAPAASVRSTFGHKRTRVSLEELLLLKREYGISMASGLRRLRELSIISERHYKDWRSELISNQWVIDEPGEYIGEERAHRFDQLLARAQAEELISTTKAAELRRK